MADKHIANRESVWIAENVCPDFCRVNKKVIPFDIQRTLDHELMHYATSVFARGEPVLMEGSVIQGVDGDKGKGIHSKVSLGSGHVRIKAGSPTVFVEGRPVARHLDPCEMNCS